MTILFSIDQIRSIKNGYDAPSSTELVEIPADKIPDTLRRQIIDIGGWKPYRKRVEVNGKIPKLTKPFKTSDAITALKSLFD